MSLRPTDILIGAKLKELRTLKGWSQDTLGKACDITFQQIQKYEAGINRISAARLFQFATLLNISPNLFFPVIEPKGDAAQAQENNPVAFAYEPGKSKEVLTLVRAYSQIQDPLLRQQVYELVRTLAKITP